MQDRGCKDRIRDCRESVRIELLRLAQALVDGTRRVNELLDRDVPVSPLSVEVTGLRRRVLHATDQSDALVSTEFGESAGKLARRTY